MSECVLEETDATNELIHDKNEDVQPLTAEEIEAMKKSGMHASVRPSRELFPSHSLILTIFLSLFPNPGHNQPSNFFAYHLLLEK